MQQFSIRPHNFRTSNESAFHDDHGWISEAQGKYPPVVEEYLKSLNADETVKPEDVQKIKDAYEQGGWDGYGKANQDFQVAFLNDKLARNNYGYV